ncbi:ATP-binding protein [Candidatus Enterococcus murrayae]|uniref:Sensor histidine kinase n=1 Tax=Candidatus Enterococcus murrayae TaxID=2815321 RepID=A0ABS3HEG1_9ENTE|nr:ATP-binding protein [Enterococcus sp. MJM16]MBO0451334.1 sensor histidine kinase [Enterococcus sp. MJM16]
MDNQKELKMNSRIIKHLGTDLITTSSVALTELIKNSIDAKAKTINILLYDNFEEFQKEKTLEGNSEILDMVPRELLNKPFCIVEDNGQGMDNYTLENGFLEIGTDIKLNDYANDTLGEKGIGRLATQRLGCSLLVETTAKSERIGSAVFIDWENIVASNNIGENKYFVPYRQFEKRAEHYTRLWIFGIRISDFLEVPEQMSLGLVDIDIPVISELRSAISFLISPYEKNEQKSEVKISYNGADLDISFPTEMLYLAESEHYFKLTKNDENELNLECGINLRPWFLERMHRVIAKAEPFKRLRKSHSYYKELLEENQERINDVARLTVKESEIMYSLIEEFNKTYSRTIIDENDRADYSKLIANDLINQVKKINPIKGSVYSFKQNSAVGSDIIINSAKEENLISNDIDLKTLKSFLNDYNGIKLYRGSYRIGFLGDQESDWLKLQQYRTRGQQFFRFDLGNTLGYISINDPKQKYIKEISSRLDINHQDPVSKALKSILNIVFNSLFYELNRRVNAIVKVLLAENGLLIENYEKQLKKKTGGLKKSLQNTDKLLMSLEKLKSELPTDIKEDAEFIPMDKSVFGTLNQVLNETVNFLQIDEATKKDATVLLDEANDQLKAIEVEAYNNYKLMANGIITEAITHELHSVSKTAIDKDADCHFDDLKKYFLENRQVQMFNKHVQPIKNSYSIISNKIENVGNLYSFLENTFIKKGTYEDFYEQNIAETVYQVKENLLRSLEDNRISIECDLDSLIWSVPKGVLLHVFYNLFHNSIYWIDKRNEFASNDKLYLTDDLDKIVVEYKNESSFIVYDTGTGIVSEMKDILFEPLQSGKPIGEGRGMGLYIVKKILNSFGANIELMDEQNFLGNPYKFIITYDPEDILEGGGINGL